MAAEIGVGIIGVGRTARAVAAGCREAPELRLVAVAEVDRPKGQAFAAEWGIALHPSHEELLARADVGAVFVLLPHYLHHPVGLSALRAGKHLFVEKPMACTVQECTELLAAAESAGRRVMVGHH